MLEHKEKVSSPTSRFLANRLVQMAAVILVAVTAAALLWSVGKGGLRAGTTPGAKSWYTSDNGRTWFADDLSKLPPFEKDGKTVSRVYLYCCVGDTKPFVGYLERFTPEGKAKLQKILESKSAPVPGSIEDIMTNEVEVAKPGTDRWVRPTDPEGMAICKPKCPSDPKRNALRMPPPSIDE
jgi:hypothetical protein